MLEQSNRKALRTLALQLALVIFAFGIVIGVVVMGITSAAASVQAQMLSPEMVLITDEERGESCGLFTTDPNIAKAFIELLDGKLTNEEFLIIVKDISPAYGLMAPKLFRDCNLDKGFPI